ncbi:MAG TPA: hypothetical protein VHO24_21465 [Opitutaceae bacterium]|nr:hypothetical protein [Opitutaceae bacterium]
MRSKLQAGAIGLIAAGIVVTIASWSLPVNLKSVSPSLLRAAGEGTSSLGAYGRDLVDSEKFGPAALVLAAARAVHDPRAPALEGALNDIAVKQPGLIAWGGWDPFLDPLFHLRQTEGRTTSTPVLTFFIPEKARETLRKYLAGSGSQGVQSLLALRELTNTGRFVPASRPGGQPLDGVILLTALLYQGEHLSRPLQLELRSLAETALRTKELGELEPFFLDVLGLGRRLDWTQLAELLRRTANFKTVSEYAHLARVAPDQLPLIYSAALFSDSADRVASYLIQYGKSGLEDVRLALGHGQGAVKQLLLRQVPVNRIAAPALNAAAELVLPHPQLMLVLKYLGYVLGAFLVLRGLDRTLSLPADYGIPSEGIFHVKSGVLAVLFAAMLVLASEPFLLKAAPPSEYQLRLRLPVLVATPEASAPDNSQPTSPMDLSTILSIGFFAALQIAVYFICLQKIREIARQDLPPLTKLRLAENEENLFDAGLYVGIGGTATALVLQVLKVIEPNLLAAYASNLFGITCVALIKIRHVRPYKRELILDSQAVTIREVQTPAQGTILTPVKR